MPPVWVALLQNPRSAWAPPNLAVNRRWLMLIRKTSYVFCEQAYSRRIQISSIEHLEGVLALSKIRSSLLKAY